MKINYDKKMDYLNALTTKLRSYLLFSTILLPCAFGSCTNSDSRAGNKDLTKSGCIELLYRSPNDLTYKISLDDSVLTYSYGGESSFFVGYKCKIKPRTSPVTPEDISLFLNNSGFSDWKLQVSENGKEVRGRKAHEISEYLVGTLLTNSPIILSRDDEKVFNVTEDNLLYQYTNEEFAWHRIEVSVGDGAYPGTYFRPSEKIIIKEDTLSYVYNNERVSKILNQEEKNEITRLLGWIDRNSTFQFYLDAADLFGIQIKVDRHAIYTSYPSSMEDPLADGIYSDLMAYIMQLSPVEFTYEDFGY